MCLGEVGRIVSVDAVAAQARVDVGGREVIALLVALDDAGAGLRPGDGVLVHLGLITEALDEATTADLLAYRQLVRGATPSPATPSPVALPVPPLPPEAAR